MANFSFFHYYWNYTFMTNFDDKKNHLYQLIDQGDYHKAIKDVDILLSQVENREEKQNYLFIKSKALKNLETYRGALIVLDGLLKTPNTIQDHSLLLDAMIVKIECLWRLGELNNSLKISQDAEKILQEINRKILIKHFCRPLKLQKIKELFTGTKAI